ncbi:pirin family protein (plasmid) [Pseudoalteromonas sp. T1lg65]|uniref:pirin family protein n=1 Tax=Pseudoalteromonas sp. T1lg65 TaxID=2077101 RepID=UPI003F78C7F0
MRYIRKSDTRGKVNLGWLTSRHSFSFAHYYDPEHMGFSDLRVINEDVVLPSRGFETHGHRDMEIISYVLEGAVAHKDSMGNEFVVNAGEIQRMSAGTGVMHSEFNASTLHPTKFLQIWIQPQQEGIEPGYQQKTILQKGVMTPLVTPTGDEESLTINQDAAIYQLVLGDGQQQTLKTLDRFGYLHIVAGEAHIDGETFYAGDAIGLYQQDAIHLTAQKELTALWFDLRASNR